MISIMNYVKKALHKFQYTTPRRGHCAPHQWTRQKYGGTKQVETPLDTLPPILEGGKCRIQQIVGTFLYYAYSVDCNILSDLN